jgi:hypothetical protein
MAVREGRLAAPGCGLTALSKLVQRHERCEHLMAVSRLRVVSG